MGSSSAQPAVGVVLAIALMLGCGNRDAGPPLPEGQWLVGHGPALRASAADLARLRGTPVAAAMARLLERTADCQQIVAYAPGGDPAELIEAAGCGDVAEIPAALTAALEDNDFAFVLSAGQGVRVSGDGARSADGSLALVVDVHLSEVAGIGRLFVPDIEPAGSPRLSGHESLVHARVRPRGGLRLAEAVAPGGQADRLFRLKSQLFEGSALAGAWEIALYPPPKGRATPGLALALDVRSRAIAQQGVDVFVSDLERTWSLRQREIEIGGLSAACFLELRILPDFTPCWVLTESALIVGWNPQSIDLAMGGSADSDGLASEGGVLVRLGRLAAADRLMQVALDGESLPSADDYIWNRLTLRPRPDADRVRVEIDLASRGGES